MNYTNILDTGNSDFGRTEAFETKHWLGSLLDKSMISFYNIIQIFGIAEAIELAENEIQLDAGSFISPTETRENHSGQHINYNWSRHDRAFVV